MVVSAYSQYGGGDGMGWEVTLKKARLSLFFSFKTDGLKFTHTHIVICSTCISIFFFYISFNIYIMALQQISAPPAGPYVVTGHACWMRWDSLWRLFNNKFGTDPHTHTHILHPLYKKKTTSFYLFPKVCFRWCLVGV